VAEARAAGLDPDLLHATNSAAILAVPAAHFDLLRAGVGLYGPGARRRRGGGAAGAR
jgi:alanine racemase